MTAINVRTQDGKKTCVPTTAQISFNARDRLAGHLDDVTVRQAVEVFNVQ